MRKAFFLFSLIFSLPFLTLASHYMGGEITWECQSNGQYIFTMKVYRECYGIQFYANETLTVLNNPSVTSIPMTRISQTDISPQCNLIGTHITCDSVTAPNQGAIEEQIYKSASITLTGVPPAQGWIFCWQSCCRNPSTSIMNASALDWLLRAVMYSYTPPGSTTPLNANPCFDNSPTFAERPSAVLCTGYPFAFNYNAFDKEHDSLAYEWAPPLEDFNIPITDWVAGYSYNSPLPGILQNPNNVPATVNPYTGEIFFTSFTQGAFQTVVKVTAYKCGQKVAEIFREVQIVLLACGSNSPPIVTAPFQNPVTLLYTSFIDTVYAGALVTFPIAGTDFEYLPNGQPQTMTINASGAQFGTNFTDTISGCINPPCAVFNPPPPIAGQFGVQTNFSWQTDCSHLVNSTGNSPTSFVYNFVIKVQDDFCPVSGLTMKTIIIVIVLRKLPPPEIQSVQLDSNNNIVINWLPIVDSLNIFNSYRLFYAFLPNGPYYLLDSITNINQTSYLDSTLHNTNIYFYLKTAYGCNDNSAKYYSKSSDTLHICFLEINNPGNVANELSHTLYPNPSDKFIVFEFAHFIPDNISFILYDNKGALIFKKDNINGQRFYLEQDDLETGLYFYCFYNLKTGAISNGKLVIL